MPSNNTFSTADSNYDGPLNSMATLLRTVGDVQKIHYFTETILSPILLLNVISLECIDAIQALETIFSSKNIADTDTATATTQNIEEAVETFICNTFTWKFPSNLNPLKREEYSSSIFRSLIRTFNVPLKILVDLVRRLDDPSTTLDDIPLIKGLISSFIDGLLDKKDHSSLDPSVLIDEILLKSPLFDIYSLLAEHADDPFISDTTTTDPQPPPPLESILSEHFDLSIKLHHLLSLCPMSSSSQRQNLLMSALQHLVKSPTTERFVVGITINLLSFTDHHSYLLDFLSASLECFESWSNLAPVLIPLLLNLRQTLHDKQDLHRLVLIIKEFLLELSKKECLGVGGGIGIGIGGFVVSDGDEDPLEIIKELSHPLGLLLGDLHSRHGDRLFVDGFISGLAVDFPLPTPKKVPTSGSGISGSGSSSNRNPLHSCLPVLLGSIGTSSPTTLLSLCVIGIKNQLSNRKLDGLKDFLPPPTPPPPSSSITALPNFISIFSKKEKKERSTPGSPLSLLHLTEASTHQFLLQLSLVTPVAAGRSFDDCLEIISLLLKDLHHNVDPLLKEMIVRRKKDHHHHQHKNDDNDNVSILPQPLPITTTLLQVLGCLGSLSRSLMQLGGASHHIKKLHILLLDLFIERSLFFLELGRIHKHAMGMVFNGSAGGGGATVTPNRYSPLIELDLLVAMISSTVDTTNTKTTYSDDETQHFQEFWLLFSYVGYISTSSAGRFRPSFSRHLCAISTGTPLLLRSARTTANPNTNTTNARNFSTILLEGEGEQQEHLQVLRAQLSRMLGTKEKALSLPQCLWLISISLCESGRREMDCNIITTYLTDASLDRLGLADRVELLMSNLILERGGAGGFGNAGAGGGRMTSSAISKMLLGLLGHNNMRAHRCAVSVITKLTLPVDPVIWDLLFEKLVLLWMLGRRPLLSTTTTTTSSSTTNLPSTTNLVRELQGATEAFRDVRRIAKDVWTIASRTSPLKFFRWASKTINDPSFKGAGGDRNIGCLEIFRIVLGDDIGAGGGGGGNNHSADTDDLRHLQTMPFSNNEDYFMLSNGGSDHISMIRARIDSVEDGTSSTEDLLPLLSTTATTTTPPPTTVEILGTKTLIFNYFIESLNDPAKREDNIQVSLKIFKSATQLASIKSIEYLTELANHPSYALIGGGGASSLERSYFRYVEEYLRSIKRFSFDKETFSLFQHCEIKCLDRIIELMERSLLFMLFGRSNASSPKSNKIPLYDKKTKSGRRISLLYAFIHIFGREREDRQVFLTESAVNQKHSQTTPSPLTPPPQTLLNDLSLISLDLARLLWERGNMKTGSFAKEAWRSSAMQFLCNPSLITFTIQVGLQIISSIPEILFIIAFCPSLKDCMAISCLSKHTATPPPTPLLEVAIKNLSLRSLMSSGTKKLLIPQLVQILRFNTALGRSLLQVLAKGDSGFAHQLIWNMRANQYTDDEGRKEDPVLGLVLEGIIKEIVSDFTKVELSFYEEEFRFFSRVTQISSTIKPLLKKEKWEKKKKIDEELEKVEVQATKGLYLPSNPECVVKAIKYGSGRPLQSHAKTPFMASFLVVQSGDGDGDDTIIETSTRRTTEQAVIFKVGDDCRQDVLALQLISLAKEILGDEGLSVYLFPYRVVATGPGQGVIEVIPNSISRDQLGREKINSLYDYFVYNFGDSPQSFHQARCNYVRSMAAYSVVCYLFAIKDRHNGNIMLDDEGHVVHIDFGFILDIGPGGVFENAPFKLTSEMLQLMGGKDDDSQYFWWFRELCVQTFLLLRTRSSEFINLLEPMIASGLPCFTKGLDPVSNKTIKNMRARFRLDLDSSGARQYMYDLVYHSSENVRTALYDKYQLSSNGIPY